MVDADPHSVANPADKRYDAMFFTVGCLYFGWGIVTGSHLFPGWLGGIGGGVCGFILPGFLYMFAPGGVQSVTLLATGICAPMGAFVATKWGGASGAEALQLSWIVYGGAVAGALAGAVWSRLADPLDYGKNVLFYSLVGSVSAASFFTSTTWWGSGLGAFIGVLVLPLVILLASSAFFRDS